MKTLFQIIFVTVTSVFFATSCQRNSHEETFAVKQNKMVAIAEQPSVLASRAPAPGICNPDAYIITLESRTQANGYWEWVWSIQNPNPGNGRNGTMQDLSHWGMQLGSCVNPTSVISAAYSSDGSSWTNFTPTYESDPSQGCMTSPVLKFEFGTSGSAKTYYQVVVSEDFTEGPVQGYYMSGIITGCCTFNFTGISGCGGPPVEFVE